MSSEIYVDGSCYPNPGPGAWAYVVYPNYHQETAFEENTTNNRMELMAMIKALEWAVENDPQANIYSDSKYCVNSFNKWVDRWIEKGETKANMDLMKSLYALKQDFQGKVKWVKGHNGTYGNEEADMLAENTRVDNDPLADPEGLPF